MACTRCSRAVRRNCKNFVVFLESRQLTKKHRVLAWGGDLPSCQILQLNWTICYVVWYPQIAGSGGIEGLRFSLWTPVSVFIILRFVARPLLDHPPVFTIAGEAPYPITGTLSTVVRSP